jgi:sugar phosphate permease
MGAIIGVMLTGVAADRWLQNKRFIMILILNILLYVMDIYLFVSANNSKSLKP